MRQYFCAINDDKSGLAGQVISDSQDEIAAFVEKHDVPGRSVYWCPNPLRDDAKARNLETVREVVEIVSDIDFRQLDVPEQEVVAALRDLLITPTEIRNSGGGRHIIYKLLEPVSADDTETYNRVRALQKRLAACLSADPAPAHPAALFRVPGTHNTKYGKPILVEVVGGNGMSVGLTELEEMCDLMGESGLFKRKEKANGGAAV